MIGNFIGDALAGRSIHIKGDGTFSRSYLYGADLAIWFWTILFRTQSMVPINVGSAREVGVVELAQAAAKILNPHAVIDVACQPSPGSAPSRYVPSVDRAKQLLGLYERVNLEESIRRTAAWYGNPREG